jgi:hypothetical protein
MIVDPLDAGKGEQALQISAVGKFAISGEDV